MKKINKKSRVRLYFLVLSVLLIAGVVLAHFLDFVFEADVNPNMVYYYVSPSGNDSNIGTINSPYLTLEKARDAVRGAKTSMGANFAGATVYLRDGVYPRTTTFTLTSEDSGSVSAPIKYLAYQDEKPVIRGSQSVTGWMPSPTNPNIIQADLSEQGLGDLVIKEIYLNDERQILARTPNYITPDFSQTDPYAGNWNYASQENNCATTPVDARVRKRTLIYNESDLSSKTLDDLNQALSQTVPNPPQMEIYPKTEYWNNIIDLASVDTINRQIILNSDTSYDICQKNRYLLQNFYSALDTNKEWYQDRTKNLLYFMPGRSLSDNDRVSVPLATTGITLNSASYINFQGLTFEEFLNNGIVSNSANNISITNNTFRSSRGQGVVIYATSHDIKINWNLIYAMGSSGIYVENNGSGLSYIKNLTSSNIKILNNTIHDIGNYSNNSYAIKTYQTVGVVVGHNEIYNLPRLAIGIYGNDNIVEFNKIYNINLLTNDSGGIYLGARSWIQRGNIVRNNYIKDTNGYGKYTNSVPDGPYRYGFSTSGIYLDDYTSGTEVYNNIVINATTGCFQNHLGRDNSYTNNICIEGGLEKWNTRGQMSLQEDTMTDPSSNTSIISMWNEIQNMTANGYDRDKYFSRYPELANITSPADTKQGGIMINNTIKNNIYYFPSGPSSNAYNTYNLSADQKIDQNVYWPGLGRTIKASRSFTGTPTVSTWENWNGLGFDLNSLIIDPSFADSNVGTDNNMNFSLKTDSPALSLGFKEIDTSKIGLNKPIITINSDKAFTYKGNRIISGTKSPEVTQILVNNVEFEVVEGETTWSKEIVLPLGQSTINLLAMDGDGIKSVYVPLSILRQKLADANNDGAINARDFSMLMSNWSSSADTNRADFNEDGKVNIMDFSILMSNWGK